MNTRKQISLFFLIVIGVVASSCLEPFNANVAAKNLNVLVVEGYINADTSGITRIQLSKVSSIAKGDNIFFEEDAEVRIESDLDESYMLTEKGNGVYESQKLDLPADGTYRLFIKLSNGKEYRSDLQPVKITPPIDSVTWEFRDQLYIYANAHDDQSATFYYTWKYQEDWQIRSRYRNELMYTGDTIIERGDGVIIPGLDCYGKAVSSNLILASTRQLTRDVVYHPVATVPMASEKIQTKYRIRVIQRTMTEDEYNYIMLMKKNSEITGSFFDPMPSQLFGNIHQVDDPAETVIGYISTYTTTTKDLFIFGTELPPQPVQEKCPPVDFDYNLGNLRAFLSNPAVLLPYQLYQEGSPPIWKVTALPAICLDCRLKVGSSSIRPDW